MLVPPLGLLAVITSGSLLASPLVASCLLVLTVADIIVPGRINLIDVSSMQGVIDFKKVKEAGFRGVYVQSSRYSSTRDLPFQRNVDGAKSAGLAVGAYHFCSHNSSPEKQAEFFHRACGGLGSNPGELPPMLDWEHCTPSAYENHPFHCVQWVNTFANSATALFYPNNHRERIQRRPTLYTFPNYAKTHQPALGDLFPELDQYPLTYASYKGVADSTSKGGYRLVPWLPKPNQQPLSPLPKPWTEWKMWQYSGNNGLPVPGVKTDCDRILFNGTEEDFQFWLGHIPEDNK